MAPNAESLMRHIRTYSLPLMIFFCSVVAFGQKLSGPVQIQTSTLGSDQGPIKLFVTVRNQGNTPVEKLALRLEDESGSKPLPDIGTLAPSQAITINSILSGTGGVLIVEYTADNQRSALSLAVRRGDVPKHPFLDSLKPLGAALGGALAALAGALLTAILTARRERAREQFEWSKFLYERYEDHYRRFVNFTAGTTDPEQIRRYFDQLEANALVSPELRMLLNSTTDTLRRTSKEDERRLIRDDLLSRFARIVAGPMGSR